MHIARPKRHDPAVAAIVVEELRERGGGGHARRKEERRRGRTVPARRARDDRARRLAAEEVAERRLRDDRAVAHPDESARDRPPTGELDDLAAYGRARAGQPSASEPHPARGVVRGGEIDVRAADLRLPEERERGRIPADDRRELTSSEPVEARESSAWLLERDASPDGGDLALRGRERGDAARDRPVRDGERGGEDRREKGGSRCGAEGDEGGASP